MPGWENILGTLGPDRIEIANAGAPNEAAVGLTLAQLADERGDDPVTTALDLMLESALDVTMILHYASADAVHTIAKHRLQLVGSDGIFGARPHPRLYGTAPRFLGRFAPRGGFVGVEEAVAGLTARAADRLGLGDRGRIEPGKRADLVLLDPARYVDTASYADPCRSPDGVVGVMWGDTRDDPEEIRYHVYFTKSEDQGQTFGFTLPDQNFTAPDTRVTDFPSNANRTCSTCAPEIGDYWSMTANEKDFYLTWGDTRLGEFGGFNVQIAFARQQAIQAPSLFLNPPSGTAGRVVDIQGLGFQPDSSILLLVSGVVVANPRTNDQGQFTTSIYMPLTGEGPTSISAFDETGNAATASFYTEFGFDTLQRSLEAINQQINATTPAAGATTTPTAGTPSTGPRFGTPVAGPRFATPVPSPTGSPVASTLGGSTSSGEPPLSVSSIGQPTFGGLALALMGLGAVAAGGLFLRRWRLATLSPGGRR